MKLEAMNMTPPSLEAVSMTTQLNVEMIKELRATLEALNAAKKLDGQDNPSLDAATTDVIESIRIYCKPMVRWVLSD